MYKSYLLNLVKSQLRFWACEYIVYDTKIVITMWRQDDKTWQRPIIFSGSYSVTTHWYFQSNIRIRNRNMIRIRIWDFYEASCIVRTWMYVLNSLQAYFLAVCPKTQGPKSQNSRRVFKKLKQNRKKTQEISKTQFFGNFSIQY